MHESIAIAKGAASAAKVSADRLLRVDRPFMFGADFTAKDSALGVDPRGGYLIAGQVKIENHEPKPKSAADAENACMPS
jgi:hypothetical protein